MGKKPAAKGTDSGTVIEAAQSDWSPVVRTLLLGLLLLTMVVKLVPFAPNMPTPGLDGSWVYGTAVAAQQKLAFGTQTIFTSGPYSPVYTKVYIPQTYPLMLLASLYLALAFFGCFFVIAEKAPKWWPLLVTGALLCVMGAPDSLLFGFPLALGVAVVESIGVEPLPSGSARWAYLAGIGLLFGGLGLLPLVKGTMLVLCAFAVAISFGVLAWRRAWELAAVSLAAPLVTCVAFWMAIGQRLSDLPGYFSTMGDMISGYSEAMSLIPQYYPTLAASPQVVNALYAELLAFIVVAAFMVLAAWWGKEGPLAERIAFAVLFGVFLALAFKSGFVRHDGHAMTAAEAMLIAMAFMPLLIRSWIRPVTIALAIGVFVAFYLQFNPITAFNPLAVYASPFKAIAQAGSLRADFERANAEIKQKSPLPHLNGTSDIYFFSQSDLITSGNTWNPRPVLQSYSAYTPRLAELDRDHLLGASAPDNLIVRLESLDFRYPTLDDGASFPAMFGRYRPIGEAGPYVFLRKVANPAPGSNLVPIGEVDATLGQIVKVPVSDKPVFVKIDVSPTLFGRLVGTAYRPGLLIMSVQKTTGTPEDHRFISGMGRSGFVLSPFLAKTKDFAGLYYGEDLSAKRVVAFSIRPAEGDFMAKPQWKQQYHVEFDTIESVESSTAPLQMPVVRLP